MMCSPGVMQWTKVSRASTTLSTINGTMGCYDVVRLEEIRLVLLFMNKLNRLQLIIQSRVQKVWQDARDVLLMGMKLLFYV